MATADKNEPSHEAIKMKKKNKKKESMHVFILSKIYYPQKFLRIKHETQLT